MRPSCICSTAHAPAVTVRGAVADASPSRAGARELGCRERLHHLVPELERVVEALHADPLVPAMGAHVVPVLKHGRYPVGGDPGVPQEQPVGRAVWGSAFSACPASIMVATQVVRSLEL